MTTGATPRRGARRVLLGVAAAAALAGVFALYLQPGLAYTLASQLWACF